MALRCSTFRCMSVNRNYSVTSFENFKLLSDTFGLNSTMINSILKARPNILQKDQSDLMESYIFCRQLGMSVNDIIKYPSLLVTYPVEKYHHYHALKDAGCDPIDAHLLSRARTYLRMRVGTIKKKHYLKPEINVVDSLVGAFDKAVEKPIHLQQDITLIDNMKLSHIHMDILEEWLTKRLSITKAEFEKLLRVYKMIKNKSLRIINENITIAESIGMSREKILKSAYILHNWPEYPKTMLQHDPNFIGLDMAKTYKTIPKLMMVNPKRFHKIYAILKEYHVSDRAIQAVPGVFMVNTETLVKRLDFIQTMPDFKVLLSEPDVLRCIIHYNVVRDRLNFMKKYDLKYMGLPSLVMDIGGTKFDSYLKKDENVNAPKQVLKFFANLLDKQIQEISELLRRHPYYRCVPFGDINETFEFFTLRGYTKESLSGCMYILLYPRLTIEAEWKRLDKKTCLKWHTLSQIQQLNLILYFIEKKHVFSGKGIMGDAIS